MTISLESIWAEEPVTLASLESDLRQLQLESLGFESAHAPTGMLVTFGRFMDRVTRYMNTSVRLSGSKERIYNIKPLASALTKRQYMDFVSIEVPVMHGQVKPYELCAQILLDCTEHACSAVPGLLIPMRDALGRLVNRPELLNAALVADLPRFTPAKATGLTEAFGALSDSKTRHTTLPFSKAFGSLTAVVDAGTRLNQSAELLQRSPRMGKDLSKEIALLVSEIANRVELLRKSIEHMGDDRPSPEILMALSQVLYNCAAEVEFFGLVRARRHEAKVAYCDATDVIYKAM